MEDVIGNYGGRLLVAIAGVGIALACLVVVLRFIRNRGPLPFLRGNSGRQARLQVLDSTAVDTRRRLVLVRRDNVEHLIMIGGPTDVVIESRIVAEGDADYDDVPDAFPAATFYDDGDAEEDDGFEDSRTEAGPRPAFTPPWREEPARAAMSPADAWRSRAEDRYNSEEAPVAPRPVAIPAGAPKAAPLPETARRPPPPPSAAAPIPAKPAAPAAKPTPKAAAISEQMNDFERMLEAEMASRLEAGRANQPRPASPQPAAARPPATPAAPRATGGPPAPANPDQRTMQAQMARIFGGDNS